MAITDGGVHAVSVTGVEVVGSIILDGGCNSSDCESCTIVISSSISVLLSDELIEAMLKLGSAG